MTLPMEGSTLLGLVHQNSMGYQKCISQACPLIPIVSSIGSVTYETSKELSRILKPLVGRISSSCVEQSGILKTTRRHKIGT